MAADGVRFFQGPAALESPSTSLRAARAALLQRSLLPSLPTINSGRPSTLPTDSLMVSALVVALDIISSVIIFVRV